MGLISRCMSNALRWAVREGGPRGDMVLNTNEFTIRDADWYDVTIAAADVSPFVALQPSKPEVCRQEWG